MSEPADRSVRFWDRIAERYARQPIADPETYQEKLALTQRYLAPDANVLEFGCGTGSTALVHAPKVGHLLAIDTSPKMIDIANGKLDEAGLGNLEFRCVSLFDLDDAAGSYDAVLALNVLHLIDDYPGYIRRSSELLKPGGVFVSSTVCLGRYHPLRLVLPIGAALGRIPRVKFFSAEELEAHIADCGLEIVEKLSKSSRSVFLIATKES